MSRQSKIISFGCLMPLLLICLCSTTLYFRSDAVLGAVARLWGGSRDDVLTELAENQPEPAVNWTLLNERSNPIVRDVETSNPLPEPAVVTIEEVSVVRVKVQDRAGEIDTKAIGVSKSAEIVNDAGQSSFVFEYNEANLNEMVITTANAEMSAELKEQVILERVELAPSALIISGKVDPGIGGWQSLGIITTVGSSGKSLEIVGIDIGGTVLDGSAAGPMQSLFGSVEQDINEMLQDILVISGSGSEVPLSQIYLGDGVLQVVFENQ